MSHVNWRFQHFPDSDGEDDKETEEEIEEKKPAVTKKPGIPGGIGFGVNIMADLKAKQEKRKSQVRWM